MPAQPSFTSAKSLVLACAALLLLSGCNRMKESINSNNDFRSGAVESARKSCVQTASANLPGASPELTAKVNRYCDCFATQGLQKFSNTELMEIGLSGGKISPETRVKINQAAQMCIASLQTPAP